MDRQAHEYAAAMAFAQQQQQQANMQQQQQQQQFGFHPQPQQFPPQMHGGQFLPHPSLQQFPPYHPQIPSQQQLYAHHQQAFPHLQQQQQLPHSFPPHPPPHHMSPPYMPPLDPASPQAAPPSDPELQKRIDKLVEYSAKNGPEFEAMIREKQQDNPDYNFLFGGEGYNYYRYKLWLSTRPSGLGFNQSFRPSSMPMMPPSHSPMNPSAIHPPLMGGASPGLMLGESQMHQPSYPPFYDQHQQPPQPYMEQGRAHYDLSTKPFKGLSGPLPSDVGAELINVLINLNGTKESIKGAKIWFMQRSPFAPALAEALRDMIFNIDDSEKQLHIIFLVNDILFDSLQRRANLQELDNEALAFKHVLGSMLGRVYNNPHNKDSNQSRLEKILQFWASKEVYDQETVANLEKEMTGGLPLHSAMEKDAMASSHPSGLLDQQEADKHLPPNASSQFASGQFMANQLPAGIYPPVAKPPFATALSALPSAMTAGQPLIPNLQSSVAATGTDQAPPPYPLFPPGLIPGMVRKMQIGSGVPYSPLSPLDIPTVIPPSTVPQSEILERVSKFFKEIGEANPSEGPMIPSDSNDEDSEYEREEPVRKGGACIPPPPNLQVDPETGTYADGSVDRKPGLSGSGRLGLGATADPNEISQYDDVYSSYRKQRSTNYHTSMSARATAR